MLRFFENFDWGGGNYPEKKKKLDLWTVFEIFKILKIRDDSFVALLILRHLM